MPEETNEQANSNADEELLRECREDFAYCKSYWSENYDEAKKDVDCVLCIPPAEFKDDRAGRPCIWPDEVSQYVNQTNNNMRQTKRAMKISPRNEEARDEDAEHRQAYIQGIEYASKAQSVYSTAFESCVECGFGYWRVTLKETGPNGEQEPRIKRIPNWGTVFPDPDAKESDFSDSNVYFVTDSMRQTTFAKRYPKAKKQSFTGADTEKAPGWLNGDSITVAEWWKREELGEGKYKVTQRIVNGLEIIETNEWIGNWIPIIGCFGLEKYQANGNSTKRLFLSLIRRARGAQQMLAYIASQEAEEFGMAPRAPFILYEGTVNPDEWKTAHKTPRAYLQVKVPVNWQPQWGPPPMPARQPFIPNAQAYEVAFERWRRSIQAAVGINPLPTAAQRQNEKSGIALQKIQTQEQMGSFHFTDNFVRALVNTGIQVSDLITKLAELDSLPETVLGKDQKGEDKRIKIAKSTDEPKEVSKDDPDSEHLPEADLFFAHRGQFEIAVSDGPSDISQREEVSEFVDTLLQTLPPMGLAPQLTQQIMGIAVKLKNIGTYGDEIADLLAPPSDQNIPPQAKALVAQSQAQLQMATAEIQKLQMEKQGKIIEHQGKLEQIKLQSQADLALEDKKLLAQLTMAEVNTKAQNAADREADRSELLAQFHDQAHDVALQAQQQSHDQQMAQQQAQAQSQQSAQDAAQTQAQQQVSAQQQGQQETQ